MHRGSSKGTRAPTRLPEALPLSASRPLGAKIAVVLEIARAGTPERRRVLVARGASIRDALRAAGAAPEGSAVLCDGVPQPLDTPIERALTLTVVPTFSGG